MPVIRISRFLLKSVCVLLLVALLAWCVLAINIDSPAPAWLNVALAVAVLVASALAMFRAWPFPRRLLLALVAPALVNSWWLTIEPSNDRDWLPDVAREASFVMDGDKLTVENMRDFRYRSDEDFDERWISRTYDLSQLVGMDLFMSYWGPRNIAHTIASFEFADGSQLAVSIETRKEKGEEYSALLGFFRQYELTYVVVEERDVIGVRAQQRGEQLFLYRLAADREKVKGLLLEYVRVVNKLAAQPAWYNALTTNCTTTILHLVEQLGMKVPLDWRFIANGHLDELQYERGSINTTMPFADLRARSDITKRAQFVGEADDFSRHIRVGLPARPTRR